MDMEKLKSVPSQISSKFQSVIDPLLEKLGKSDKFGFYTVITVDPAESTIKFLSMTDGQKSSVTVETQKCRARLFDDEFFKIFNKAVGDYAAQHPTTQPAGVSVVLPDRIVATDVLNIPTLRKRKNAESLDVAIGDLYRNASELKINRSLILQNKQYSSYYLSIMQSSILTTLYTSMAASKMVPQAITFASNSAVNAVQSLVPKLHNATYMLMDIKAGSARLVFVSKGMTCGYFNLPFGYSVLERRSVAAEDMLMDHSVAEYIVYTAKAKAKAKQNMMNAAAEAQAMADAMGQGEDQSPEEGEEKAAPESEPVDDFEEEENDLSSGNDFVKTSELIKNLPKKQPRKLPKFMQRPTPHTEEECAFENFRPFVKWALNLIAENKAKLWHEKPEAVYVNLPADFAFVLDMVNEESEENGISFLPLDFGGAGEDIVNNLDSYGGFFTSQFNSANNF